MPSRREFLRVTGGVAALMLTSCRIKGKQPSSQPARRPNILFIMSDDHATRTISAYGSSINQTPNIDRIGREGVRFDNCFCVNSLCVPSRAAVLTGKYGHKNGVRYYFDMLDQKEQTTFPRLLRDAGYSTALIGKWHLSGDDHEAPVNPPSSADYDYWNVLPGQGSYRDPVMYEMGEKRKYEGHATDIFTDLAIEFLEKRDPEKPFCLLCHHKAPHGPLQPAERHAHLFEDVEIPLPPSFYDDQLTKSRAIREKQRTMEELAEGMSEPRWGEERLVVEGLSPDEAKNAAYQKMMKGYLRVVAGLDENVGRLMEYMKTEGILENTIVFYTTDNGFFLGEHQWHDKRLMYEEALRLPLLVRYPAEIRPNTVNKDMVLEVDFAPTILDFANLPIPDDMQGHSLRPILNGRTPKDWRKSMFYIWYHQDMEPKNYGVRTERYKLIHYPETQEWELYDLQQDRYEITNLYADQEYAGIVKQLKKELKRLCRELDVDDAELLPMDQSAPITSADTEWYQRHLRRLREHQDGAATQRSRRNES